jgi:hypothetical protein
MTMRSTLPHEELINDILSTVRWCDGQIALSVPIGSTPDRVSLLVNLDDNGQLVLDVFSGGRLAYSGITAADMRAPMCPVFKH